MRDDEYLANRIVFSQRFKQLRLEKGLSQDDFSKYLGISRVSITYYERAETDYGRLPDSDNLIKICNKCNCSADYLLGFTNERNGTANEFCEQDALPVLEKMGFTKRNASLLLNWSSNKQNMEKLEILNYLLASGMDLFLMGLSQYLNLQFNNTHGGRDSISEEDFNAHATPLNQSGYSVISVDEKARYIRECLIPSYVDQLIKRVYDKYETAIEGSTHEGYSDEILSLMEFFNQKRNKQ